MATQDIVQVMVAIRVCFYELFHKALSLYMMLRELSMSPRFSKRQWFIIKWTYPPLQWATGAVLLAYFGFLDMALLPAFLIGFMVGLVHDLGLVVFGVGKWGDGIQEDSPPPDEFH